MSQYIQEISQNLSWSSLQKKPWTLLGDLMSSLYNFLSIPSRSALRSFTIPDRLLDHSLSFRPFATFLRPETVMELSLPAWTLLSVQRSWPFRDRLRFLIEVGHKMVQNGQERWAVGNIHAKHKQQPETLVKSPSHSRLKKLITLCLSFLTENVTVTFLLRPVTITCN
jgi:hypothetical protein